MTSLNQNHIAINNPAITIEQVTPEVARAWLERNTGNRSASMAHVAKLEKTIRDGGWKMTGDPIRFSKGGSLLDGQHRLHAILQSGIAVTCVVMRGFDESIFDVLDSGKGRQKSDVLFVQLGLPVETCKMLATATTWVIDYEKEQFGFPGKAEKTEVLEFVKRNPLLIAAAEYAHSLPRQSPVPRSIAAMFYFYASQHSQAKAERFLERFMVGAVDGVSDNLLYLRNRCFSASVDRRPIHRSQVLAALIRTWNAEVRGKPIKHATNVLRTDDTFPTFI
ncbi:hypothetical protein ACU8WE_28970 [Pseudomonas parakoreensis]